MRMRVKVGTRGVKQVERKLVALKLAELKKHFRGLVNQVQSYHLLLSNDKYEFLNFI